MSEVQAAPKQRFDARLREILAEALAAAASQPLVGLLSAEDRLALKLHSRLLDWMAPQRLIELHEAAALAARGDGAAFEAMVLLAGDCYRRAELAEGAPIVDALKAAVAHPAVMAAVEAAAAPLVQAARTAPMARDGRRVAFVVSSLIAGAATTYVMRALAGDLAAIGWQVEIYQTLLLDLVDEPTRLALSDLGVRFHRPPADADQRARAAWMDEHLRAHAVDVVVHYVWPNDFVAKLLCNLRCVPLQVYVNHTCDQPTGDFDLKIGYSGDYRGHHQADRYITLPNCSVRAAQARKVEVFDRSVWGLAPDVLCLATFSRLSKCVDATFLEAMAAILRANPRVVWLLVGERAPESEAQINAHLAKAGVLERVVYAGFMHGDDYFALLKAIDIYCDTIGWMGGQTVADAVACGVPVVCCAPGQSTVLAPHGNSSTVIASQLLAPGSLVARPGDAQDYARLAQAYIDEPELRRHAGTINARSVDPDAWPAYVREFDAALRAARDAKRLLQSAVGSTPCGRSPIRDDAGTAVASEVTG
ncbi:MAG: glycosyltransferase [Burkholderiales bacterium]|nr:glycosyltransferase [Burkholderiales bacterium]